MDPLNQSNKLQSVFCCRQVHVNLEDNNGVNLFVVFIYIVRVFHIVSCLIGSSSLLKPTLHNAIVPLPDLIRKDHS